MDEKRWAERKADLERQLARGRTELLELERTCLRIEGALALMAQMEREAYEHDEKGATPGDRQADG